MSRFSDANLTIGQVLHGATGSPEIVYYNGGAPFNVVAVFDSAGALVDLGGGVFQRTAEPQLGCVQLDVFPLPPKAGDTVTVAGVAYTVSDIDPDGQGGATLRLRKS